MTDFLTKEEGIMRIFRFSSERKQFNTASFAQKQRGKNNCLKTILNLKKNHASEYYEWRIWIKIYD